MTVLLPVLMRWTAPLQRHRHVLNHDSDGPTVKPELDFSERQLLAINGRFDHVFATSVTGGKADIERDVGRRYLTAR